MVEYIYRIRREALQGGDFKYHAEMNKVFKNEFTQALHDFVYGWRSVLGYTWIGNREKDCKYAKKVIDDHKARVLNNFNNSVVKVDFVDVDSCE